MHKIGPADVLILGYSCGVSQYPQVIKQLKINIKCSNIHMLQAIQVKGVTNSCKKNGLLNYKNQLKYLLWFQSVTFQL